MLAETELATQQARTCGREGRADQRTAQLHEAACAAQAGTGWQRREVLPQISLPRLKKTGAGKCLVA